MGLERAASPEGILVSWYSAEWSWASSELGRGWRELSQLTLAALGGHWAAGLPSSTSSQGWSLESDSCLSPGGSSICNEAVCAFFPACGHGELLPLWVPED